MSDLSDIGRYGGIRYRRSRSTVSDEVLFPPIPSRRAYRLAVDPPHNLYIEECGTADGLPVVFLHGGPGAGCEPYHRRFFDPSRYRIVLFDQRGCGRSTPHGELERNNTRALIADLERIREFLGIDRWVVFGGSWGSTLGLAYAQANPARVLALILRGVFLCRQGDLQWFYQEGASRLFPDLWQDFLSPIDQDQREDLIGAYHRLLTGTDEVVRMRVAKAWSVWEGRTATLRENPAVVRHFADPMVALALARIESHYFVNRAFLGPDQLLRDAAIMRDVPGVIVHGRYDVVCPVDQAFALHRAWPQARLEVVADAGHSAAEPGILAALVRATEEMVARFS